MKKVIILHGTKGSPEINWFPWLAAELAKLGVSVLIPRFPTPEKQTLSDWRAAFAAQVGALDNQTIVIGHSLGAAFLLRLRDFLTVRFFL